jgi:hypothetical protein
MERGWWGTPLASDAVLPPTYLRTDGEASLLDRTFDGSFDWLRAADPATDWGIGASDVDRTHDLAAVEALGVAAEQHGLALPTAMTTFLRDPGLIAPIRSFTGCWLDLPTRPIWSDLAQGHVVRFLADQQGVLFWYVVLDGPERDAVIVSTELLDPDLTASPSDADDGSETVRCADDLESFLYRFWLENEIAFRRSGGEPLDHVQTAYLARLQAARRRET